MSEHINITINGQVVNAQSGERLIDVAQREGTYIPRFCYHPKLSIVASCRMCLVDVEGHNKPLPACATPVTEGMIIRTKSEKAIEAQKIIMQFLLINHPLACPICDQGGECELQDTAMGYGPGVSEYTEEKRVVEDEDLGPLVATDMSLCIHCTRCVRFGKEVAGIPDLGLMGRSDSTYISTYLKKGLGSELSGNMIDLCPVGALTSKPFKYRGRSWGFKQHKGVSLHDCIGSNLYYHTIPKGYDNLSTVMRVLPRNNEALNQGWLSDRDRFSYEGIHSTNRLTNPMKKINGEWIQIGWEEALTIVTEHLASLDQISREQTAVWVSPSATMEEGYLCQTIFRKLGVDHIDHYLQGDVSLDHQWFQPKKVDISQLKAFKRIVLIGSNVRYDQPILSLMIKEAEEHGTRVEALGAIHYDQIFKYNHNMVSSQELATACYDYLSQIDSSSTLILIGQEAICHPQANEILQCIHGISSQKNFEYIVLHHGANTVGLSAAGCQPQYGAWGEMHQLGKSYHDVIQHPLHTVWLHNIDPVVDMGQASMLARLEQAYVIAAATHITDGISEYCDMLLPISATAETPGSFVNYSGKMQSFLSAKPPEGDAKMGWSLYQVIGNILSFQIPGDFEHIQKEILQSYQRMKWPSIINETLERPQALTSRWVKLGLRSWVRSDIQVRHAPSLQAAYPVDQTQYSSHEAPIETKIVDYIAPGMILYEGQSGVGYTVLDDAEGEI